MSKAFFLYLLVTVLGIRVCASLYAEEANFNVTVDIHAENFVSMPDLGIEAITNPSAFTPTDFYISSTFAVLTTDSNSSTGYSVSVEAQDPASVNEKSGWVMKDGTKTLDFALVSNKTSTGKAQAPTTGKQTGPRATTNGFLLVNDTKAISEATQFAGSNTRQIYGYFADGVMKGKLTLQRQEGFPCRQGQIARQTLSQSLQSPGRNNDPARSVRRRF